MSTSTAIPLHPNGQSCPSIGRGSRTMSRQRLELAYQEIQRRDSQAEHRAWRKDRLVQRLGLVILVLAGVLVWLVLTQHQVKAFVQTVQVRDERHAGAGGGAAGPLCVPPAGRGLYGDGGAVGAVDALARARMNA